MRQLILLAALLGVGVGVPQSQGGGYNYQEPDPPSQLYEGPSVTSNIVQSNPAYATSFQSDSGDVKSIIARILYQLTDGAVTSLDGTNIPEPHVPERGQIHFFTAVDPTDGQQQTQQSYSEPVIIQPEERTHAFIAISPFDIGLGDAYGASGQQYQSQQQTFSNHYDALYEPPQNNFPQQSYGQPPPYQLQKRVIVVPVDEQNSIKPSDSGKQSGGGIAQGNAAEQFGSGAQGGNRIVQKPATQQEFGSGGQGGGNFQQETAGEQFGSGGQSGNNFAQQHSTQQFGSGGNFGQQHATQQFGSGGQSGGNFGQGSGQFGQSFGSSGGVPLFAVRQGGSTGTSKSTNFGPNFGPPKKSTTVATPSPVTTRTEQTPAPAPQTFTTAQPVAQSFTPAQPASPTPQPFTVQTTPVPVTQQTQTSAPATPSIPVTQANIPANQPVSPASGANPLISSQSFGPTQPPAGSVGRIGFQSGGVPLPTITGSQQSESTNQFSFGPSNTQNQNNAPFPANNFQQFGGFGSNAGVPLLGRPVVPPADNQQTQIRTFGGIGLQSPGNVSPTPPATSGIQQQTFGFSGIQSPGNASPAPTATSGIQQQTAGFTGIQSPGNASPAPPATSGIQQQSAGFSGIQSPGNASPAPPATSGIQQQTAGFTGIQNPPSNVPSTPQATSGIQSSAAPTTLQSGTGFSNPTDFLTNPVLDNTINLNEPVFFDPVSPLDPAFGNTLFVRDPIIEAFFNQEATGPSFGVPLPGTGGVPLPGSTGVNVAPFGASGSGQFQDIQSTTVADIGGLQVTEAPGNIGAPGSVGVSLPSLSIIGPQPPGTNQGTPNTNIQSQGTPSFNANTQNANANRGFGNSQSTQTIGVPLPLLPTG